MANWAAVGGHGYRAASATGLLPLLSVAGHLTTAGAGPHGGPTVPATTSNTVDTSPLAFVVTRWLNEGAVQLTEMELLTGEGSATVGCLASVLHSRMLPMEFLANPLPVRVTAEPFTKPVVGDPVNVVAANADIEEPRSTAPPTTRTDAATMRTFARDSRPPERPVANID